MNFTDYPKEERATDSNMKTPSLIRVTSYLLGPRTKLIIAEGSVCDYAYSLNKPRSGIVNAANEECLGGGGVGK